MDQDREGTFSAIEYSLLGLLGQRPMHGYEIYKELCRKTGLGLIWAVGQAQLYAILAKLEAAGLVAAELVAAGSRPARRVLHRTGAGTRSFEAWRSRPSARRDFRIDFLAKLHFAQAEGREAAATLLDGQTALCERWLAEAKARSEGCPRGGSDPLVYSYRLGQLLAMRSWLEDCRALAAPTAPLAAPLAAALGIKALPGRALVVAFVGAGGKTSAMFALARELAGFRVIVTTTTRIFDPRREAGRDFNRVIVDPSPRGSLEGNPELLPRADAGALVLASGLEEESGKLLGLDPARVEALRGSCDLILVEADGSRGLPIKAPAPDEPPIPPCADLVVGLIGLDCLGAALGPETAHRPELLASLLGCAPGSLLGPEQLLRLTRSPLGLFKDVPAGARRALILNKADALQTDSGPGLVAGLVAALAEGRGAPHLVLATCLREDPVRIVAMSRGAGEGGA
jgi:PadR family transcriptional regulator, regulatory protein AphA